MDRRDVAVGEAALDMATRQVGSAAQRRLLYDGENRAYARWVARLVCWWMANAEQAIGHAKPQRLNQKLNGFFF